MDRTEEDQESEEDREYERAHFYFMGRYELSWITATSHDDSWRLMHEHKRGNCLQCLRAGPSGGSCCFDGSITFQTNQHGWYINPMFITKVVNEDPMEGRGETGILTVLNENGVFRQRMPADEWKLWGILLFGTEYFTEKNRIRQH